MTNTMRNSGIPWIGDIPSHWRKGRYKFCGSMIKGKLPVTMNASGVGLPIIGASEMNGKHPKLYTQEHLPSCTNNDILILWDGANAGLVAHGFNGIVSSTVVVFKNTSMELDSGYLYYQLKSEEPFFRDKVNGTTIPHMNSAYIDELCTLIPSLSEQKAIAEYLDRRVSQIETVITLKQSKIEKLKQYRQSLIYEYVTGKKEVKSEQ